LSSTQAGWLAQCRSLAHTLTSRCKAERTREDKSCRKKAPLKKLSACIFPSIPERHLALTAHPIWRLTLLLTSPTARAKIHHPPPAGLGCGKYSCALILLIGPSTSLPDQRSLTCSLRHLLQSTRLGYHARLVATTIMRPTMNQSSARSRGSLSDCCRNCHQGRYLLSYNTRLCDYFRVLRLSPPRSLHNNSTQTACRVNYEPLRI
jgi:hypothetical protein